MSTIVLRSVKNSPLTNAEVDANFSNLNTDKLEASTTATLTNKTINLTSNTLVATSAQLAAAVTDETGSGALVFATSPTLVTPTLGVATATSLQGIIGNVTPAAGAFTDLSFSGTGTVSGGTANGVAFLNGSKVLTTGSALTFDGTNFSATGTTTVNSANSTQVALVVKGETGNGIRQNFIGQTSSGQYNWQIGASITAAGNFAIIPSTAVDGTTFSTAAYAITGTGTSIWSVGGSEQMRLTSTGLGIGTSSPGAKLDVTGTAAISGAVTLSGGTANGVAYLNGSKVLTTGSALTFDGTNLLINATTPAYFTGTSNLAQISINRSPSTGAIFNASQSAAFLNIDGASGGSSFQFVVASAANTQPSEQMRLTSTGLGLGTSSPSFKLDVSGANAQSIRVTSTNGDLANLVMNSTGNASWSLSSDTVMRFKKDSTEYMRLDSSGNLGIGTSSPAGRLSVKGSTSDSSANALFVEDSSSAGIFRVRNDGDIYMGNGGKAILDSSGNLGLGVTPSAWDTLTAFQIKNGSVYGYSTGDVSIGVNNYYGTSNFRYITSSVAAGKYTISGNQHAWYTAPSGTAGNAITFTQAMTLDASGNLLVGGTTNSGMATVQMSVGSTSTASSALQFLSTTSGSNGIYFGDGTSGTDRYRGYLEYNHTSDFMVFATAATERARITSGGYFKASFDGTYNSATGQFHEFVGNVANGYTVRTRCANASPANHYINEFVFSAASPNNTGALFIECRDSTAARFELRSNGGLANYSANDVNLSDRREKTNFAPAKSYLDTICAIPVQTFNYADQNMEDDPGLTLGVVAQDVQAVAPELVMESNWGTKDEPKMRLSIYQTDLQYALMKALQELKAEFDAYKASHP